MAPLEFTNVIVIVDPDPASSDTNNDFTTVVVAVGFLSFRFNAALYDRGRAVSVLQEAQRIAFVRKEKSRIISVAQPQKRLVKVA